MQGTYGRGEVEPKAHLTANLMGINVLQLDKAQMLTPYQAHDWYLKIVKQIVVSPSPANAGNLAGFVLSTVIRG